MLKQVEFEYKYFFFKTIEDDQNIEGEQNRALLMIGNSIFVHKKKRY